MVECLLGVCLVLSSKEEKVPLIPSNLFNGRQSLSLGKKGLETGLGLKRVWGTAWALWHSPGQLPEAAVTPGKPGPGQDLAGNSPMGC